jgi:hypothetical protein
LTERASAWQASVESGRAAEPYAEPLTNPSPTKAVLTEWIRVERAPEVAAVWSLDKTTVTALPLKSVISVFRIVTDGIPNVRVEL